MSNKQNSLNRGSVYKLVNKRLGFALLVILLIVGSGSYFLQQHRLLKNIQEVAIKRANQYTMHAGELLSNHDAVDNGDVQQRFDGFSQSNIIFSEGIIVSAIVLDNRGKVAIRYPLKSWAVTSPVNKILEQTTSIGSSELNEITSKRIKIDNTLYILLHFPVKDASKQLLGQAALLFLPAAERLQRIQVSVWKTTLAAMAIVIFTTLAVYPIIIRLTRQLSTLSMNLLIANLQTAKALGNAIAKRDSDTDAHNYRVTIYSVRLAEALGLETKKMQGLIKGAFLHDVGKIGTPDNILLKPGKLTDNEFLEMKNHVGHGVDIIKNSSWLQDAEDVVLHHHEKYNGDGYSTNNDQILAGKDIPLVARIFAIADVFDALTSRRPYKEPFDFDSTMEEMEKSVGTHFDPELFATFKTIAKPLYDQLANRENELPINILTEIVQKYFLNDLEQFLS